MTTKRQGLPRVVSREEWRLARRELARQGKVTTRARDALNAERRRLPMLKIERDYVFDGCTVAQRTGGRSRMSITRCLSTCSHPTRHRSTSSRSARRDNRLACWRIPPALFP
jgi:hypothetical protein